jgi:peroxiredoxin (alkyl hydroperoxide reductase subunit C)
MSLLVGKKAPEFSATAVMNGGEIVKDYSLSQFEGNKYVLLFFYPKDFSAVCPIEMQEFQANLAEFEKRNVQVIACSTDTDASHKAWLNLDKAQGGIKGITYPIVADLNKTIAHNYHVLNGEWAYDEDGQLHAEGDRIALRGTFLIDKQGIVRYQSVNFFTVMRHVDDILREIDAWQYFEERGEVCPLNYVRG